MGYSSVMYRPNCHKTLPARFLRIADYPTFSSGKRVIVNFGEESFTCADGTVVPGLGFAQRGSAGDKAVR